MGVIVGTNMMEILETQAQEFPRPRQRKASVEAFQVVVSRGDFKKVVSHQLARSSRKAALDKWRKIRADNPSLTDKDIREMQRQEAVERKKLARQAYRESGVGTRGKLTAADKWRVLEMGDTEDTWKRKLSFIPALQVGTFSTENLKKLQEAQERLVEAVRLRGGAQTTKKHQKGVSMGVTVSPGGRRPRNPQERSRDYSGTIQLKTFESADMKQQQEEVTAILTECIEEAFGHVSWYKAAKEAFRNVPKNRRLPNSSLPGSNIWWNWNINKSTSHIDSNAVSPCFVLTPYTYNGAELLCGANNHKIPMEAGKVVGGSWHQFPHCNDTLWSGERYSFVVYFDYRMLQKSYWIR
jgi:hypothetical protein